ncbi:VWA domain-containing protein [Rhabdaerophilum sp. SD176]|uniref:VWA domain-containing protein n=1 Tax=Rhabdaerophilum sp. SD176 TaxID=2983548 RepID=UPI0024DF9C56|nr:VWA domain-containing protein [Rhabdaerophilum sp. SD176]
MRLWLLALALFCLGQAPAMAQRTLIVLDASGSMWGQIEGKPKLQIARDALRSVLAGTPADAEIGLLAYGHREKGNCADIELVVPPGKGKAAAVSEAAARLKFLGKTPLTEAVRQAAVSLRYTEEKATVILITDGVETCQADPCALAEELAKAGVGFTAHVVGFGLSREEGRKVACLAEKTGGRYIPAGNAGDLQDALRRTVSVPPRPEAAPPVKLPAATIATKAKPVIGQGFAVDWTGPAAKLDYIDIVPVGWKAVDGELSYVYIEKGKPTLVRAPGKPGTYDMRYVWAGPDRRHVLATTRVTVGDTPIALDAPASVPAGTAFSVAWKGPGRPGDYVDLVRQGSKDVSGELSYAYVESGNPVQLKAPGDAGRYDLRYVLEAPDGRKVLVTVPIEVTPSVASLAFPPNAVAGGEVTVHWRGPAAAGDYLDIVPDGQKEAAGELSYAYVEQSPDGETSTLRVPGEAGRYRIRYILEAAGGRKILADQLLVVAAAQATVSAPASVQRGTAIPVSWTGPNGGQDYIDLVPQGSQETSGELTYFYTANAGQSPATLQAPDRAGRYEIRYILEAPDGRRILARTPVEIR